MRLKTKWTKRRGVAAALAASAVLTLLGRTASRPLRHAADLLLAPVGAAPMYAATALKGLGRDERTARAGEEQVRRLRQENRYLSYLAGHWKYQHQLQKRRAQELANFHALYRPTSDLPCELVPARVVGTGGLPYTRSRILHTPSRDDIIPGEPVATRLLLTDLSKALPCQPEHLFAVVTGSALVGRIVSAGAYTARLQLLSDRDFQMAGRIRRVIDPSRPRMVTVTEGAAAEVTLTPENNRQIEVIARGDGADGLIVEHVKAYHNVRPGDLLVTSGDDRVLPTEINVGQVTEVRPEAKEPHRVTLRVRPHADLGTLRDVFIVVPLGDAAP